VINVYYSGHDVKIPVTPQHHAFNIFKMELRVIFQDSWKSLNGTTFLYTFLLFFLPSSIIASVTGAIEPWSSYLVKSITGAIFMSFAFLMMTNSVKFQRESYWDLVKRSFKKIPAVLATYLLFTLSLFVLSFFLVIPALFFMIYCAFSFYAVLFNDKIGTSAFKYSFELVKGRFWKVLANLVGIFGIGLGIRIFLWSLILGNLYGIERIFGELFGSFFSIYEFIQFIGFASFYIINDLVTMVLMIVMTVFYLHLERR
jgi:hypothetical protein